MCADAVSSAWIGASFVLANLIAMLPVGRIADIHGRKKTYLAGLVIFLVANLVAGIAASVEILLLSRVLQGIGGGQHLEIRTIERATPGQLGDIGERPQPARPDDAHGGRL